MKHSLNDYSTKEFGLFSHQELLEWHVLNDSIMGGSSKASCKVTSEGLLLEGDLVEDGGGFVSFRSPVIDPPLKLSEYKGLCLKVDGFGRTLKIALRCKRRLLSLAGLSSGDLVWVAAVPTNTLGTTIVQIPFKTFEPTIRAQKVSLPFCFDPSAIIQFQLLHSKFGQPGELNPGFRDGSIRVILRSILGYQ